MVHSTMAQVVVLCLCLMTSLSLIAATQEEYEGCLEKCRGEQVKCYHNLSKCKTQYHANDPRHILDCWNQCDETLAGCHGNWKDVTSKGCVSYLRDEKTEKETDTALRFTPLDDGWIDTWGETAPSVKVAVSEKYHLKDPSKAGPDSDDENDDDDYDDDSDSHLVLPKNESAVWNKTSSPQLSNTSLKGTNSSATNTTSSAIESVEALISNTNTTVGGEEGTVEPESIIGKTERNVTEAAGTTTVPTPEKSKTKLTTPPGDKREN